LDVWTSPSDAKTPQTNKHSPSSSCPVSVPLTLSADPPHFVVCCRELLLPVPSRGNTNNKPKRTASAVPPPHPLSSNSACPIVPRRYANTHRDDLKADAILPDRSPVPFLQRVGRKHQGQEQQNAREEEENKRKQRAARARPEKDWTATFCEKGEPNRTNKTKNTPSDLSLSFHTTPAHPRSNSRGKPRRKTPPQGPPFPRVQPRRTLADARPENPWTASKTRSDGVQPWTRPIVVGRKRTAGRAQTVCPNASNRTRPNRRPFDVWTRPTFSP
jgi:hypothetical protein